MTENEIREAVGVDTLADYLAAPWGQFLGIYPNGTVSIGEDVGREIDPRERPAVVVKSPGIENLDMTWWREGWECGHLSDEEVLRDCCKNGDIEGEYEDLIGKLVEKLEN